MKTKVKDIMTADPVIISPTMSLRETSQKMKAIDCGILPVGTSWDRLEGVITDRDIVLRAVAENVDMKMAQVRDYMTKDVHYCNENDSVLDAAEQMRRNNVFRLVVKDSNDQPCGILTLGCILRKSPDIREVGEVVGQIVGRRAAAA